MSAPLIQYLDHRIGVIFFCHTWVGIATILIGVVGASSPLLELAAGVLLCITGIR